MSIPIQPNQLINLQQIESVVAGPDGANRLFIVTGQAQVFFGVSSPSAIQTTVRETFTIHLGPTLSRQQFIRAIATASVAQLSIIQSSFGNHSWGISGIDADWDDESGQVELRLEVFVVAAGLNNSTGLNTISFQVTILAEV